MQNIEIKTSVADPAAVEERARELGAVFTWERHQRDVFFHVHRGYLKLRLVEGATAELIAYVRAPGTEPRPSDYDIAVSEDGDTLERVLTRSHRVRGVVEKTRRLWLWRHTRIHIDQVSDLGDFLELETLVGEIDEAEARHEADLVIAALDLDPTRFLDRPYLELIEAGGAPSLGG